MPILLFGQKPGCNWLKLVKINQSFSGLLIFKMPQPQPVVRLHLVAFGPVLVVFSVLATRPLNTRRSAFIYTDFILMASSSSELAFKNLSESVRTSLQMLNALRAIPSSGVISSPLHLALNELVNAAVCKSFNLF